MTTMHMDVEATQNTQKNLVTQSGQLKASIDSAMSSVNQTIGSAWIGNSASEFQGLFDDLQRRINQNLQELERLNAQLQNEIVQWVDVQSKLG